MNNVLNKIDIYSIFVKNNNYNLFVGTKFGLAMPTSWTSYVFLVKYDVILSPFLIDPLEMATYTIAPL